MPLPDDWKKLSALDKLTSAQLMAGDEVIMLTVGNKGARSELREIQSIIIDGTFNATQLPGGVESNDTVIIKRGGDYFVATMNQVLGGAVSAIEEYSSFGDFPGTGSPHIIYVAIDTGVSYRWGGSVYVPIVSGQGGVPIDNHAALSVVGRDANSVGDVADIVAGTSDTVLKRDGNSLVFDKVKSQDIDSQEIKTGNLDNKAVTTGKLDDNAVEDGKFRQSTGLSVVGRAGSTTGNVGDITAASDNTVLKRDGNSLVFDEVKAADIDMSDLISSLISENPGGIFRGSLGMLGAVVNDCDTTPFENGFYRGFAPDNAPGGGRGYMLQIVYSSTSMVQVYFNLNGARMSFRFRDEGSSTAWKEVTAV